MRPRAVERNELRTRPSTAGLGAGPAGAYWPVAESISSAPSMTQQAARSPTTKQPQSHSTSGPTRNGERRGVVRRDRYPHVDDVKQEAYGEVSHRVGAFVETLAQLRPDLSVAASLEAIDGEGGVLTPGVVPLHWLEGGQIGETFLTAPGDAGEDSLKRPPAQIPRSRSVARSAYAARSSASSNRPSRSSRHRIVVAVAHRVGPAEPRGGTVNRIARALGWSLWHSPSSPTSWRPQTDDRPTSHSDHTTDARAGRHGPATTRHPDRDALRRRHRH